MFRNIVFEIEQYYLCQLYILWQDGIQLATVHSVHHFDRSRSPEDEPH